MQYLHLNVGVTGPYMYNNHFMTYTIIIDTLILILFYVLLYDTRLTHDFVIIFIQLFNKKKIICIIHLYLYYYMYYTLILILLYVLYTYTYTIICIIHLYLYYYMYYTFIVILLYVLYTYSYTMHQFYIKCNMTKPKLIQTCSYQTTKCCTVVPTQLDKNACCFTHFCVIY